MGDFTINTSVNNTVSTEPPYEMVNHPSHYNKYDIEVIDMMRKIWGDEATMIWCKLTAFKYRMRLGEKPDNSIQQDLDKEKFYLSYYKELSSALNYSKINKESNI